MDRSRETSEFRETDPNYMVLAVIHVKYVSIFIALFGLLAIVGSFGAGISFFPWAIYDTTFDVIAITGFVIYAISGILVHIGLLHSVQNTDCSLAIPFILYHCFLVALEAITSLIAVGELVADQTIHVEEGDQAARATLIVAPMLICVETIMVYCVFKLRTYLRNKRRHIRHGLPPPLREVANDGFRFGFSSSSQNEITPEPSVAVTASSTMVITAVNETEKQDISS